MRRRNGRQVGSRTDEPALVTRALVHHSPVPILQLDPDGRVRFWNQAAERLSGWPLSEALGRPPPCLPAGELRRLRSRCRSVLLSGAPVTWRCQLVRRDGSTLGVAMVASAIPGEEGQKGVAIYIVDAVIAPSQRPGRALPLDPGEPPSVRAFTDGHRSAPERLFEILARLLTADSALQGKLDHIARELVAVTGYEAIDIFWWDSESGHGIARSTVTTFDGRFAELWAREPGGSIMQDLQTRGAPVVFRNPSHDARLAEGQRAVLRAAGIRSAAVVPLFLSGTLCGVLSVGSRRHRPFGERDVRLLKTVGAGVTAMLQAERLMEGFRSASQRNADLRAETVLMLAAAAEARDRVTGRHLRNVRFTTELLAGALGHPPAEAHELGLAAVLHDIGKIRVPDRILGRRGLLSATEWRVIQRHTVWGSDLLSGTPDFRLAALIARHHHERWDGTGYPDGLAGPDIPEAAAIVSVADALDAMISPRPYRPSLRIEAAVAEIEANAGTQFSPAVVHALLDVATSGALDATLGRRRAA